MSHWDDSGPAFWAFEEDELRTPGSRPTHRLWRRWRPTTVGLHERATTPLADLPRAPLPPEPPRIEPANVVEPAPLSVQLMTTDGVPLQAVELVVRRPGFETRMVTDGDGVAEVVAPDEGLYEAAFAMLPVDLPPPSSEPAGTSQAYARKLPRDCPGFELGTGARRQILVVRPSVTEVLVDGYAAGSSVLRWGGMRVRTDKTVGTARGALRLALWLGRGRTMCVTGHADPIGQDQDNDNLSRARAQSLQLFASGQLDEWAQHAFGLASELDFACAMAACNRILGMGPVALDDDEAIDAAHAAVRLHAGLADDAPVGAQDWRAIADLYELDLAAIMFTDVAGLADMRRAITWTDPAFVALGERRPRPIDELDAPSPMAQRRCGLCIFGSADTPQIAVDRSGGEIYDGTYRRVSLEAPGEVLVDIAIDTPTRESIARARAWISVGAMGVREHVAGLDGHVRFMTLRGDPIEVVAAFDADGHGAIMDAGVTEP